MEDNFAHHDKHTKILTRGKKNIEVRGNIYDLFYSLSLETILLGLSLNGINLQDNGCMSFLSVHYQNIPLSLPLENLQLQIHVTSNWFFLWQTLITRKRDKSLLALNVQLHWIWEIKKQDTPRVKHWPSTLLNPWWLNNWTVASVSQCETIRVQNW